MEDRRGSGSRGGDRGRQGGFGGGRDRDGGSRGGFGGGRSGGSRGGFGGGRSRDGGSRGGFGGGRSFGGPRRDDARGEGGQGFNRDAWGNTERSDFRQSGRGSEGEDRPRRSEWSNDRPRRSFGERSEGRGGSFRGGRDGGSRGGFGGGSRGGFGGGRDRRRSDDDRGGFRGERSRDGFRGRRREDSEGGFSRREDRADAAPRLALPENAILIMGRNCIQEVLKHNPERFQKIYVGAEQGDARLEAMVTELSEKGVEVERVDRIALNKFCESESHQGIAAAVSDRNYQELNDYIDALPEGVECRLLLLDAISDPQNFGAILRAAECFGVNAVVWSRNRSSGITPTVSKVSCGASELVTLLPVNNLADAVAKLKSKGFWIYSSTTHEGSQPMSQINFDKRSAIILGSEGYGVQDLLLKESDFKFFIPQSGRIDSLNVSQACAVILAKLASVPVM